MRHTNANRTNDEHKTSRDRLCVDKKVRSCYQAVSWSDFGDQHARSSSSLPPAGHDTEHKSEVDGESKPYCCLAPFPSKTGLIIGTEAREL